MQAGWQSETPANSAWHAVSLSNNLLPVSFFLLLYRPLFPEQICHLLSFCLYLSHLAFFLPSCAHSFFSYNQVEDWHKLTESRSYNNHNRLPRERSQGHNETLWAQGGLPIKSYYASVMPPLSEWESWGWGGSIDGEQHKQAMREGSMQKE